ncbi:GH36-type glycosyl hydrolase domain-containing protein [Planctomicrobium sp. SH527]|uniref:GH36-type glycosyl hydrolase domain-containing protein n=1 Tax=Planctomicrobium sp. SH527 TaxID=3448123 RepID=UPI003F5C0FC3
MPVSEISPRVLKLLKRQASSETKSQSNNELPLRDELFSLDQLERHAKVLAAAHRTTVGRIRNQLLSRLSENEKILLDTYDLVESAASQDRRVEPAAEWLIDNFYLIEEQIRSIRRMFPPSYSRQLPHLVDGKLAGLPRVYSIALEIITHLDGHIDMASLDEFISSYQEVENLKLGELWALPLMLQLALIENLRRVAKRIASARHDRDLATQWAEQVFHVVEDHPSDLILVLADMARSKPPLSGAFISELTRHIQGQNPIFSLLNSWLEHRLTEQGLTTEHLISVETQAQAADQVSIGNSIGSLRFIDASNWRDFVEKHSIVEKALSDDPVGVYQKMDFATRDRYRHAVEAIARRSKYSEYDVARKTVQLAEDSCRLDAAARSSHLGYFLIDDGRLELERAVQMSRSFTVIIDKIRRFAPLGCYLFAVAAVTGITLGAYLFALSFYPMSGEMFALLTVGALLAASSLGVSLANWVGSQLLRPEPLPRMDFENGIPSEHRTVVAVPTMLTGAAGIERLLDSLEVRFLANQDPCLHFALVTDFVDADQELLPGDDELVRLISEGITRLNDKYGDDCNDRFYLFHRGRQWNEQEGVWMGYERKRGKLADLNATLQGRTGRFSNVVGDIDALRGARYVITLDTDTQLPRDAAFEMVGSLAHVLNRPVFNAKKGRVVKGYGILQPRVGISLPSALKSRFARMNTDDPGIDPYTRVVSDLYQDLAAEGSYIGKGIYDIEAFERSCENFPENTILSHDLIEGAYARSGLLSDVTLFEDFPSSYLADMSRRHRWTRGDWQIARWILPWIVDREGKATRNSLSLLSRWKIFDNLRRSVVPIFTMLLLLASWACSTAIAGISLLLVAVVTFMPLVVDFVTDSVRKPINLPLKIHLRFTFAALRRQFYLRVLELAQLPYEAFCNADAIGRTLFRMFWSKRKLLEWRTASDAERTTDGSLLGTYRQMAPAPVIAAGSLILLAVYTPSTIVIVGPLILVWAAAPLITWRISQPIQRRVPKLSEKQLRFLAVLSRKTWRFFEEFVTQEENWLPPDNVSQNSGTVIAHRTSPTNIGMALLSELAAYDFGYCSASQMIARVQGTFSTLSRMERYQGHFYNWYDTRTLVPLNPHYVSMVDSGNLVANLLVLKNGFLELRESPILSPRLFQGMQETLFVLHDVVKESNSNGANYEIIRIVERQLDELRARPTSLNAANSLLTRLNTAAKEMEMRAEAGTDLAWWTATYSRCCRNQLADLQSLACWVLMPTPPKFFCQSDSVPMAGNWFQICEALEQLDQTATLQEVANLREKVISRLEAMPEFASPEMNSWFEQLLESLTRASDNCIMRIETYNQLVSTCNDLADMDFELLYNKSRDLFRVGYNVSERRHDVSCYDLLASEARLASYIVVAQGEFDQSHWFALGRLLTKEGHLPALLSWSGSIFEYLMPLLVMPNFENTLLDQTCRAVVRRQIEYGRRRGVPWGISESGYNLIDQYKTYQYRAFGVPGLGLKRGLAEDIVIAPYATALALMVEPEEACQNLERLAGEGFQGEYGFYEAIDYTPSRIPPGMFHVIVRQFMAHHQGMSFLSLAYLLLNKPMQRRFVSDPTFRSAELLLQERVPKASVPVFPHATEASVTHIASAAEGGGMRVITDPNTSIPAVHLLSNGRYHVAVSNAGGGYSRWQNIAVTRWREDTTCDRKGAFCYLRDVDSGEFWSNTWQPTVTATTGYEAIFTQSRAEFRRIDYEIETYTQISVSPEDDVELRRITLTNLSDKVRTIEVTTYADIVLAPQAQDEAHAAFSNLFVQTEIVPDRNAIFCTRRPRSADEHPPWLTHLMNVHGKVVGETSYETDRMKFLGRQRSVASPAAFDGIKPLSNTEGPVLDPIIAIRKTVQIEPNQSVRIDIVTAVAESRAAIEALTIRNADHHLTDRVFDLAWTHSHILLQQIGATEADAQVYGRLASSIIYPSALHRAKASVLMRNRKGQSGLWGYGISGDLPIALVRIRDGEQIELVRQAVLAHSYWRHKGLSVDLVIWNEDDSVYRQTLQDVIVDIVAASSEASLIDRPGGVFIRRGEQMSDDDRALLQAVARVVLMDDRGTIAEQATRRPKVVNSIPYFKPVLGHVVSETPDPPPHRDLAFFNGIGGFSHDGREYVMILNPGETTPAPWVNVIANAQFGTVISEGGAAYTWAENSHEFRITPWNNDAVGDISGEAMYLRDEETGHFWSPTPLPARGKNSYVSRHGFGYSIFDYTEGGITTELCVYVDIDSPVKFYKLKVHNHSGRTRYLSATAYWELVLGDIRSKLLLHVVTESDTSSGAILAHNVYSQEFNDRVAFMNCSEANRTITGDRREFLGRNGSLAKPDAMRRVRLSGQVGAGYDPCAAIQTPFSLADGSERIITFTVGAARGAGEARMLSQKFRSVEVAHRSIERVWDYWSRTLGVVHLETPDASVNYLVNGWLVYQTLACRMWARSGFYQSGGAFGFRDQLQDAMALIYAEPQILRDHLLRASSRQFIEGDVQHWWHPPVGRGVRTHFSDDYLWLPLATCRYVASTGDTGVLDERVPYLISRPLRDDEESYYDLPQVSEEQGTLYEHCVKAIDFGLKFGEHGLPLMGCGDWNDGMNLVGQHGRGESVWLGFFLFHVLTQFSNLARQRGDVTLADRYNVEAGRLRGNIERHGWDGEWYRRAYFDDGTPLGSAQNQECRIDAISQSWSVLSKAGTQERTKMAMDSVNDKLVKRKDRLILLLDPPFDKSDLNPGYIKGYVPGVRENGGQYSHSAIWTVMAFAELGETERAWELFRLINPISHGATSDDRLLYRVEPYVIAADVYGVNPHTGRGGWTWYTGSAGWLYRLIVESLLGLSLQCDKLRIAPKLPVDWKNFKIHYRYRETFYHITINQNHPGGSNRTLSLDGAAVSEDFIVLQDDRVEHEVVLEINE